MHPAGITERIGGKFSLLDSDACFKEFRFRGKILRGNRADSKRLLRYSSHSNDGWGSKQELFFLMEEGKSRSNLEALEGEGAFVRHLS